MTRFVIPVSSTIITEPRVTGVTDSLSVNLSVQVTSRLSRDCPQLVPTVPCRLFSVGRVLPYTSLSLLTEQLPS